MKSGAMKSRPMSGDDFESGIGPLPSRKPARSQLRTNPQPKLTPAKPRVFADAGVPLPPHRTRPPPLPTRKPQHPTKNAAPKTAAPATTASPKVHDVEAIPQPDPNKWLPEEIEAALARCKVILAGIEASSSPMEPIKKGKCGTPAPIRLSSIGSNPTVKLSPPATVNCAYAAALHKWVKNKLQPAARKLLGAAVTRINSMSSYSCRNRYGRKTGKISEHAKANALDIGGFTLANGKRVSVLRNWGPTEGDLARAAQIAARIAAEQARKKALADQRALAAKQRAAERKAAVAAKRLAGPLPARSGEEPTKGRRADAKAQGKAKGENNGGKTARTDKSTRGENRAQKTAVRLRGKSRAKEATAKRRKRRRRRGRVVQKDDRNAPAEARFLHAIHAKACGVFGTVLGPEANEAHRNHFHFDLIKRRHRAYCE